jgi:hypothetical protein
MGLKQRYFIDILWMLFGCFFIFLSTFEVLNLYNNSFIFLELATALALIGVQNNLILFLTLI